MKSKEKIIFALKDLIELDKSETISTKKIAEKANYSEAMIYQNFKSKHEILTALLNFHREKLNLLIQEAKKKETRASLFLKLFYKNIFRYAEKNTSFIYLIFIQTRDKSETPFNKSLKDFKSYIEEELNNVMAGYTKEPEKFKFPKETIVNSFLTFFYGQLFIFKMDPKQHPTNRLDMRLDKLL
jgi:AcrR family transcriptional regulator